MPTRYNRPFEAYATPGVYWMLHPMGGYFRLPTEEAAHATGNGALILAKPNKLAASKIQVQIEQESESESS